MAFEYFLWFVSNQVLFDYDVLRIKDKNEIKYYANQVKKLN